MNTDFSTLFAPKVRPLGVGASDVAALIGEGRRDAKGKLYETPEECAARLAGLAPPHEQNVAMRHGIACEPWVLYEYSRKMGWDAIPWTDGAIRCADWPLLYATPDATSSGDGTRRRVVEAKTCSFRSKDWGESGTDVIPPYYLTQVLVQTHATQLSVADLAVYFGGKHDFEVYTIWAAPQVAQNIVSAARAAWDAFVDPLLTPERRAACADLLNGGK